MDSKCMVKSCTNKQSGGRFVGSVCAPCARYTISVRDNTEHTKQWYFTEGVVPDIRNQLEGVLEQVELHGRNS